MTDSLSRRSASPRAEGTSDHLMDVARDAAQSLETISQLAGRATYGNPPIETFMDTFMDVRLYAAARARVAREDIERIAASPPSLPDGGGEPVAWDEAQRVCDLPEVDEAIRNLIEDNTGDNATCLVRAILATQQATTPCATDAPVADILKEARALIRDGARFIGGEEGMAMCRKLDAAIAALSPIPDAPAAPVSQETDDAIADAMIDANLNPAFCLQHAAALTKFGRALSARHAASLRTMRGTLEIIAAMEPAAPVPGRGLLDQFLSEAARAGITHLPIKVDEPAAPVVEAPTLADARRYLWLRDKSGADIRSLLGVGDMTTLDFFIDQRRRDLTAAPSALASPPAVEPLTVEEIKAMRTAARADPRCMDELWFVLMARMIEARYGAVSSKSGGSGDADSSPAPKRKTDSNCNYSVIGVCRKCGREHDGGGTPWPGIIDVEAEEEFAASQSGMVMVPSEPTKAMLVAAVKAREGPAVYKVMGGAMLIAMEEEAADDYRAMVAAAQLVADRTAGEKA